jgi:hypothetical protein
MELAETIVDCIASQLFNTQMIRPFPCDDLPMAQREQLQVALRLGYGIFGNDQLTSRKLIENILSYIHSLALEGVDSAIGEYLVGVAPVAVSTSLAAR